MKTIIASLAILAFAGSAFANGSPDSLSACHPAKGNWLHAATTSCPTQDGTAGAGGDGSAERDHVGCDK